MKKIVEDLYWLMTTYNNTQYILIKDAKTNTLRLGDPDKLSAWRDRCNDLDLIHSTLAPYEIKDILEKIKGKKFKVWAYKGLDFRNDEIWKQESFIPKFRKIPVEVTLRHFETYLHTEATEEDKEEE